MKIPGKILLMVGAFLIGAGVFLYGCGKGTAPTQPGPGPGPGSNTPFDSGLKNSEFVFIHSFPVAGSEPYFCRPHANVGMTGTVNVSAGSNADTVDVVVGPGGLLVFNPTSVTVKVGGHVRWTWDSNNHTVTSGTPTLTDLRLSRAHAGH